MTPAEPGGKAAAKSTGERLYGGMTAEQRRAERRRRLLDTALELFGTDGYPYTGIERICSHAGVTARHFYEEFGSREGLLVALYDEIVAEILGRVATAVAEAPEDAIELTRAGLRAFVHGMIDDPRRARVTCLEVVGVSPALEAHRRTVLRRYADLVREQSRVFDAQRDSQVPRRRQIANALVLVGGTNELMIEWITDGSAYTATVDELIDDLLALYVGVGRGTAPIEPGEPGERTEPGELTGARGDERTGRAGRTPRDPAPEPDRRQAAVSGTMRDGAANVLANRTPPAHRRTV